VKNENSQFGAAGSREKPEAQCSAAGTARGVRRRPRSLARRYGLRGLIFAYLLSQGCACAPAAAEELSLLAGVTDTDDHTSGTYAWGLEYRQKLLAHVDASFGYLNEGHLPNHHRDGGLLQFWATTGAWRDRIALAVGAGPYLYFDTQFHENWQGYINQHGVGAILSARATFALSRRWFALLDANQVMLVNPATRIILLGVGYRLEDSPVTLHWQQSDQAAGAGELRNEAGFFAAQTVLNDLSDHKSSDFGFEYRYRLASHLELSTSLIEEASGAVESHASVMGEIWAVQDFIGGRFTVGLGVGPDVALSAYQTADGRMGASVLGLASMTASWRFTGPLVLRVSWHRGFTSDDQDRDIITVGLGLRF
jgi:hypothetical protein